MFFAFVWIRELLTISKSRMLYQKVNFLLFSSLLNYLTDIYPKYKIIYLPPSPSEKPIIAVATAAVNTTLIIDPNAAVKNLL